MLNYLDDLENFDTLKFMLHHRTKPCFGLAPQNPQVSGSSQAGNMSIRGFILLGGITILPQSSAATSLAFTLRLRLAAKIYLIG